LRCTRVLLLCSALLATTSASGATCAIAAQGMVFGAYDVFNSQSLDGASGISVSCDVAVAYTVAMSPGGGSYALRAMTYGPHVLNYNLFVDAARTAVWGDGSAGTSVASGNATSANHTVYGRIPARQNAYIGAYSDSIIVTVAY
jgi:spore coat protein U-like protein